MNTFDLFIFIPIAIGLVMGLAKGFVKEVVSLFAVFFGIFIAELFNGQLFPLLIKWFDWSQKAATTISYTILFMGTIIVTLIVSSMIDKMLRSISLGWVNRLLGGVFGALKIAIIVSVLMNIFDALDSRFNFASLEKKEASLGYYPILRLAPSLWNEAKETYQKNKHNYPEMLPENNNASESRII